MAGASERNEAEQDKAAGQTELPRHHFNINIMSRRIINITLCFLCDQREKDREKAISLFHILLPSSSFSPFEKVKKS